eukprot:2351528-Amphidinium_carterae.1
MPRGKAIEACVQLVVYHIGPNAVNHKPVHRAKLGKESALVYCMHRTWHTKVACIISPLWSGNEAKTREHQERQAIARSELRTPKRFTIGPLFAHFQPLICKKQKTLESENVCPPPKSNPKIEETK